MGSEMCIRDRYIMDNATITLEQVLDQDYFVSMTYRRLAGLRNLTTRHSPQLWGPPRLPERFRDSIAVMGVKIAKQGRQGDIGHMCRRARTCDANYPEVPCQPLWSVDRRRVVRPKRRYDFGDGDYGNPATMAVSMLCKVRQEMLTTKSEDYDEEVVYTDALFPHRRGEVHRGHERTSE